MVAPCQFEFHSGNETRFMLRHSTRLLGLTAILSPLALGVAARHGNAQEPDGLAAASAIQEAFIKAIESAEKSVVSISRDKRPVMIHHDNRIPFGRERGSDPA